MRPIPIYTVTLAALALIGAYRLHPLLAAGLAVLMFFALFAVCAFTLAGRADDAIDDWADHLSYGEPYLAREVREALHPEAYGDCPAVPSEMSGHAERNTRGRDTHTHSPPDIQETQ